LPIFLGEGPKAPSVTGKGFVRDSLSVILYTTLLGSEL